MLLKKLSENNLKDIKVIKYGFFGALTALIELVSFLLISPLTSRYVASMLSFFVGLLSSFLFNKYIVFEANHKTKFSEAAGFIVLAIVNSQISSLLTVTLTPLIDSDIVAKIISMICIAIWTYIIMNFVLFKKPKK